MSNDYRNTKYCPPFEEISNQKNAVADAIKFEHPRAIDMHNYVSENSGSYKIKFMQVYNCKCAYCGADISIMSKENFEIDHFIYEKSERFSKKSEAGAIENLVLACRSCNHKKSSFDFPEGEEKYLYPDAQEIMKTFIRDNDYYIKVDKSFKNNDTVNKFYKQLDLEGEVHRLDFLLMNMVGLKKKIAGTSEATAKLGEAIEKLRLKRNPM